MIHLGGGSSRVIRLQCHHGAMASPSRPLVIEQIGSSLPSHLKGQRLIEETSCEKTAIKNAQELQGINNLGYPDRQNPELPSNIRGKAAGYSCLLTNRPWDEFSLH